MVIEQNDENMRILEDVRNDTINIIKDVSKERESSKRIPLHEAIKKFDKLIDDILYN